MTHLPRVRMTGPLAPYRDVLWAELLGRGYAPLSARNLMRVAAHLSRWLGEGQRSPSDLTAERIEAFLRHRRACGYTCWRTPKGLAPILDALRIFGAVPAAEPAPVDSSASGQLLRDFERYLLEERGIRSNTAAGYLRLVQPFVEGLRLSHLSELEQLSAEVVSRFILHEARSSSVGYLKLKVTALRSFLRYLHIRGLCRDLAAAVPAVAGYRLSGLPKSILEEDVRRIEKTCDRATAKGRRDYAILLLLSRLGLRAREVAALTLEDVHWARGEVLVRGKGSEGALPLPHEVGEALADYLREGRPDSTSRRIFLQVPAPHRALSTAGVKMVVRQASRRAGLRPIGSHRLRHTAATSMLRRGVSLPDIAQVLRHRSLATTAIYAKVDQQTLRTLARPWPGGAA
ncbi:MAG: tyrosine-type recombinase/integrase [Desulfuromonadales bacterium]|nr:tyrosine-type recombinase/integrase [Desulfuromonadales bacterium]